MLEPLKRRDRGIARRHRGELRPHWMWSVASHGSGRANAAQAAEAASKILIAFLKWRDRSGLKLGVERVARRGCRVRSGSHAEEAAAARHMHIPTP